MGLGGCTPQTPCNEFVHSLATFASKDPRMQLPVLPSLDVSASAADISWLRLLFAPGRVKDRFPMKNYLNKLIENY